MNVDQNRCAITNTIRFSSVSGIAVDAAISGCPERHPRSKSLTEDGCAKPKANHINSTRTQAGSTAARESMYIVEQHLTGFWFGLNFDVRAGLKGAATSDLLLPSSECRLAIALPKKARARVNSTHTVDRGSSPFLISDQLIQRRIYRIALEDECRV